MNQTSRALPRLGVIIGLSLGFALAQVQPATPQSDRFVPLNLSPHQFRAWHHFEPDRPWNPPPAGRQTLNDVQWEISGVVQLLGIRHVQTYEARPTHVVLPVHQRFTALHLLHFTEYGAPAREPIARVRLHYEDGQSTNIVLRYGVHLMDWRHFQGMASVSDPLSRMVWQAPPRTDLRSRLVTALWHTPLANPRPDAAVSQIEFQSLFADPAYSLAAASLELGPPSSGPISDPARHPPLDPAWEPEPQFIQLIDEADQAPLPNAIVHAWWRLGDRPVSWGQYSTDPAGRAVFYLPSGSNEPVDLIAVGRDHAPTILTLPPRDPTSPAESRPEVVLPLRRGQFIGGRVVDPDNQPVAGATLAVNDVARIPGGEFVSFQWPLAETDPDGRWSFGAAPDDLERITLFVSHPDFLPAEFEASHQPLPFAIPSTDLRSHSASLSLSPGVTLIGLVESPQGEPLADAIINWFDGSTPRSDRRGSRTGADGRFRIDALFPGDGQLLVQADGYAPRLLPVHIDDAMKPLRLTLAPVPALRLRLHDLNDEPAANVRVMLHSWQGWRWLDWSAQTDAEGRLDWTAPPPDEAEYLVLHELHGAQLALLQPTRDVIDVALDSPVGGVVGQVLDHNTGEPIPSFSVTPGISFSPGQTHWERHRTQAGHDGRFTFRDDPTEMQGLPNMQTQRRLMVEAPGFLPALSEAFSGPTNWVVRLTRGTGPKGTVVNSDGAPVEGAEVTMAAENQFVHFDQPPRFRQMGSQTLVVVSGTDGSFELPARADIRAIVAAHPEGIGIVSPDELADQARIVLVPWARIQGRFNVGDTVTDEHTITLHRPQRGVPPDLPHHWLSVFIKTQPMPDGRFEFTLVPPIELHASLEWPLYPTRQFAWSHPVHIDVQPGVTHSIVIGGTGRTVIGRVRIEGLPEGELNFQRDVQRLSRIPSIEPPVFPPMTGPMTREEAQARIQEHQDRLRDFHRSDAGRRAARESGDYILRFQPDGTFRCDHVPPGNYTLTLRFTREGSDPWSSIPLAQHSRDISISDDSEPLNLGDIVLHQTTQR